MAAMRGEEKAFVAYGAEAADQVLQIGQRCGDCAGELTRLYPARRHNQAERSGQQEGLLRDVEVSVREHVGKKVRRSPGDRRLESRPAEPGESGAEQRVDGDDHAVF